MAVQDHVSHRRHHAGRHLRRRFLALPLVVLAVGAIVIGAAVYRRVHRDLRVAATFAHSGTASTWEIVRPGILATALPAAVATLLAVLAAKALVLHAVSASSRAVADRTRERLRGTASPATPEPRLREFRHLDWLLAEGLHHHRGRVAELRLRAARLRGLVRLAREDLAGGRQALDPPRLRLLHRESRAVEEAWRAIRMPPPP